jgi:hypothetical protein
VFGGRDRGPVGSSKWNLGNVHNDRLMAEPNAYGI